jgi:hypothetical protein
MMLQQLIEICTSDRGLFWLVLGTDASIALAYFAIPITMAVVLRHRKEDIPYPWLWTLFVTFIVACGLTHTAHVWSAITSADYLWLHAAIGVLTALASVGTAIAFALILPQNKHLTSPKQQRAELESLVAQRTREKDLLILEINHRVGNQLQILSSMVRIESRRATHEESQNILNRLRDQLDAMAHQHLERSNKDYLIPAEIAGEYDGRSLSPPLSSPAPDAAQASRGGD